MAKLRTADVRAAAETAAQSRASIVQRLIDIIDLNDEITYMTNDFVDKMVDRHGSSPETRALSISTDRVTIGVARHCRELIARLQAIQM